MPTSTSLTSAQVIRSGPEYFDVLVALIDSAREMLHLQYYIFADDATGRRVGRALMSAARRGVAVYLLVDGYGSHDLSEGLGAEMRAAGVRVRWFNRLLPRGLSRVGRRLHHKIVVVDRKQTMVGGINVADHYHGTPREPAWLDFAILVRGSVGEQAHELCGLIWRKHQPELAQWSRQIKAAPVKLVMNNWLHGKRQISKAYRQAIGQSHRQVVIANSYFLPGRKSLKAILLAAKRGVRVQLLLPHRSDVYLIKRATHFLYARLLRYGVELYEWRSSIVHAKVATVDDHWSTIGSYNLNALSDYASLELNINLTDAAFATQFRRTLQELINEGCERVEHPYRDYRTYLFSLLIDRVCYHLSRMAMGLLVLFSGSQVDRLQK